MIMETIFKDSNIENGKQRTLISMQNKHHSQPSCQTSFISQQKPSSSAFLGRTQETLNMALILQSFIYRFTDQNGAFDYMERAKSFEAQCHFVQNIIAQEKYGTQHEGDAGKMLKQRIRKFYATNDYIQVDQEHFKPRAEPLYFSGVEPAADTLVLFGIDFMKKQQLKAYFADYSPIYLFLDESNCILTFPSPEAAFQAVKSNVRQDSNTKLKVEEDDEGRELGLNLPPTPPRGWIQLKPYIYNYQKSKFISRNFQRKLYVRYATSHEKQAGFNRLSFLEELIARCKLIWQSQIKKDESLRNFLESKVQGYREAIKIINNTQQRPTNQERSRSRDKAPKNPNPNTSRQETNTSKKAPMMQSADDDLSHEIRSRSQNAVELQELVKQFQHLHMEGGIDTSMIASVSMKKKPEIDVGYKLLQPAQVRVELKHDRFNYRKYVQESLEREEKKKMVAFCDLTEDD